MRFKKHTILVIVTFNIILFQNCAPLHELDSQDQTATLASSQDSVTFFASTLYPLLQSNCADCHGVNQQPMFAVENQQASHDTLINVGLVDLETPGQSRIVQKIQGGHQLFSNFLSEDLQTAIEDWTLQLENLGPDEGESPNGPILEASFSSIHSLILVPRCTTCHSPSGERPVEDYSTYESTMQTGKILPGFPSSSAMYTECARGSMPADALPLSVEELAAIQQWILMGALND